MAFIQELIPEDVKKTFDFSVFHGILGEPFKFLYGTGDRWVIDRERDTFLVPTGGGGGYHLGTPREECFGLWLKGAVAHLNAEKELSNDGHTRTWANAKLWLPEHLKERRAEFIAFVKEALPCLDLTTSPYGIHKVHIDIE